MKWTKIFGLTGLILLPVLLLTGLAGAQSFRTGETTTVAADETVDSSLYAFGRSVDIAGTVNGDVFCGAQNVTISGTVEGDVICGGQTVNIIGKVMGDVRSAGQTVTISGSVEGNVSSAAQNFTLFTEGAIGGDAGIVGDKVTINGPVGRDLAAGGTTVTLSNRIERNVQADTENLIINSGAHIGGNVTYDSLNVASIAEGARITGTTIHNEKAQPKESKNNYFSVIGFSLTFAIFAILSMLILSLALVVLFPALIHQTAKRALASPLKTFLTGLLASLAAPVLVVALMMTGVGLPLGLLVLLLWLLVLFLSGPFFSYMLGRLILSKQTNPIPVMLLGSVIVFSSYLIPIAGFLMLLAVIWFGTGMILREVYHRTPKPKYDLK